jgi:hypothetical protein
MSLDSYFSIRDVAHAYTRLGFPGRRRAHPSIRLIGHQDSAHKGQFDPTCAACRELKAKAESTPKD